MKYVSTDLSHLNHAVDLKAYEEKVKEIDAQIKDKTGKGNDFLGWVDQPIAYDKEEMKRLKEAATYVRNNYDILVVCGIGGSYLGARAGIEAINGVHSTKKPEIIFAGQTLNPDYIAALLEYLKDKKFAINVISKSGTTTETAVAFRLLKELLEKNIGLEMARKSIFATTDAHKGALKTLSEKEGYVTFILPSDIGGRYSVQTAVGLFPLACAGIDPEEVLRGSAKAREDTSIPALMDNEAYKYAVARHVLYKEYGLSTEMLITYSPFLVQFGEWWKQLFGESEGKEDRGIYPTSATFTTDLHSLGQFVQQGTKSFFETVLHQKAYLKDVEIPYDEENLDGLNYLVGKNMAFINEKAFEGTLKAHHDDGKRDNIVLNVEKIDAFGIGYLFYFFERACAMSAYLMGINPFDQPGVEIYKKNMFHLLGKPGY